MHDACQLVNSDLFFDFYFLYVRLHKNRWISLLFQTLRVVKIFSIIGKTFSIFIQFFSIFIHFYPIFSIFFDS